jgi:DNA-binding GntR family transcriptional regulator
MECRMVMRKPNAKAAPRIASAKNPTPSKPSSRNKARPAAGQSHARGRPTPAREGAAPAEAAHSRAYAILKEAVLAGKFRPGEVVTLRSLAKQLAVGEMPVREALRRLTSEGAFEALPNRSARVPALNRRQVRQILELRVDLEGKAAVHAARNITLVQIEHLRALQDGIEKSIDQGDSRTYTALNMAFHFEIYRIADNPFLLRLIQTLWLRLAPLVASTVPLLTSTLATFRRVGTENHERLLAAFQARDPVGAEEAMHRDLMALTELPGYWESLELTPG